jgi:hypothetical protein
MEVNFNKIDAAKPQTSVPANAPATRVTEATRVPMSLPTTKLQVPEMPGYYLYWHLGKNIPAALRAGYTFVDQGEVELNQHGVANSPEDSGSTDMGTRISISAGNSLGENNEPERLYLMKLKEEWHEADAQAQASRNEDIAIALRSGTIGAEGDPDRNKRYMKAGQDLFYPRGSKPKTAPR